MALPDLCIEYLRLHDMAHPIGIPAKDRPAVMHRIGQLYLNNQLAMINEPEAWAVYKVTRSSTVEDILVKLYSHPTSDCRYPVERYNGIGEFGIRVAVITYRPRAFHSFQDYAKMIIDEVIEKYLAGLKYGYHNRGAALQLCRTADIWRDVKLPEKKLDNGYELLRRAIDILPEVEQDLAVRVVNHEARIFDEAVRFSLPNEVMEMIINALEIKLKNYIHRHFAPVKD